MVFKGLCRKLVIPLLVVFSLGWLLYMIGFIKLLNDKKNADNKKTAGSKNVDNIPYYVAAVTGPIIVIFGFLHAASSGPISAIFGSVTSFVSVFCFAGFGYVQYESSFRVYETTISGKKLDDTWLMLVGSYVAGLSWMLILVTWNCFTYDWKRIQMEDIVDEEGNVMEPAPQSMWNRNVIFAGVARKLAGVILVFVAASWCLYITGLDYEVKHNSTIVVSSYSTGIYLQFNVWAVCAIGLLVFLAAAGHAGAYGGASTAMGVCTSILGMLFVASVGYTALSLGIHVNELCRSGTNCYILDTAIPKSIIYELSGSLGMCLAWACVVALWPFYFKETERVQNSRRSASSRREYLRQVQDDSIDERVPLLYQQQNDSTGQQHRTSISVF